MTTFISDEEGDKRGPKPNISEHKKEMWLGDLFTGNRMMTLHKALDMYKEVFHYFSLETSPSIETVRRAVLEQQGQDVV